MDKKQWHAIKKALDCNNEYTVTLAKFLCDEILTGTQSRMLSDRFKALDKTPEPEDVLDKPKDVAKNTKEE